MKIFIRICWILSFIILVCGMSTCYFGQEYELNKIPPEQRMAADADFVGFEWVLLGIRIFVVGIKGLLFTGALFIVSHIIQAWKRHKEQKE